MTSGDAGLVGLVHGILWPGFLGAHAPDWLLRARDRGLAGAVLFAQNVADGAPEGIGAAVGDHGFLVGIDEEGGQVTRVQADGGSTLPTAAQLGRVDDVDATRRVGAAIGGLAARVGANVVAAPDADVNVAPANPVIGTRSFGADPGLVARHVAGMVGGLTDVGAIACAKHWPGHGDTVVDSHHGLPVSDAAAGAIEAVHVPPFAAAVAAGVPMVMTGHVVVPEWTGAGVPATHSPTAIGRLRALGFDGVVVTDALDMDAARRVGPGEAAVRALAAGCDLLCIGNPANPGSDPEEVSFATARDALLDAVRDGRVPLARLEEAHARVAALRALAASLADLRAAAAAEPLPETMATELVRRSLDPHGPIGPLLRDRIVLDARPAPSWAVATRGVRVAEALADGAPIVAASSSAAALAALEHAPAAVVVLVDRLAQAGQRAVVDAVAERRPDALVVDLGVAPEAEPPVRVLRAFGTSRVTATVLAQALRDGVPAAQG